MSVTGSRPRVAELAEEALGHPVEEVAALQGLELPPLLRLERGGQPEHVLKKILEPAARERGEAARGDRGGDGIEAPPHLVVERAQVPVVRGQPLREPSLHRPARLAEEGGARGDRVGRRLRVLEDAPPVALPRVERVVHVPGLVLHDELLQLDAGEGPAHEGGARGREEERRHPLAPGPRVGAGVGKEEPLLRLAERAREEPSRLPQPVLGRGERLLLGAEERELGRAALLARCRLRLGLRERLALRVEEERDRAAGRRDSPLPPARGWPRRGRAARPSRRGRPRARLQRWGAPGAVASSRSGPRRPPPLRATRRARRYGRDRRGHRRPGCTASHSRSISSEGASQRVATSRRRSVHSGHEASPSRRSRSAASASTTRRHASASRALPSRRTERSASFSFSAAARSSRA